MRARENVSVFPHSLVISVHIDILILVLTSIFISIVREVVILNLFLGLSDRDTVLEGLSV